MIEPPQPPYKPYKVRITNPPFRFNLPYDVGVVKLFEPIYESERFEVSRGLNQNSCSEALNK